MNRPSQKDILFLCIVIFLVLICCMFLIFISENYNIYEPRKNVVNEEYMFGDNKDNSENIKSEDDIKQIYYNDLVYISKNGKAYHIDESCAGNPENVSSYLLKDALNMGKTKCKICAKDYVVIKEAH